MSVRCDGSAFKTGSCRTCSRKEGKALNRLPRSYVIMYTAIALGRYKPRHFILLIFLFSLIDYKLDSFKTMIDDDKHIFEIPINNGLAYY